MTNKDGLTYSTMVTFKSKNSIREYINLLIEKFDCLNMSFKII